MAFRKNPYGNPRFGEKPVKEGEIYDVAIEGIGSKGDGIGKIQGFVIIVPSVKKGDNVKVKITAVRGKVAFGQVVGAAEAQESAEESEGETQEGSEETEEGSESESEEDSQESEEEPEDKFEEATGKDEE